MREKILALDEAMAVRVLSSFARAQLHHLGYETEYVPEMRAELIRAFEPTATRQPAPSPGDLARQALILLAEDPRYREALSAQLKGPPPESFAIIETAVVVTAAIVVLQTHVKFERGKDGRFSLKVEKRPTSDSLLKSLVEKLLAFPSGGLSNSG